METISQMPHSNLTVLTIEEIEQVSGGMPQAVIVAGYVVLSLGVVGVAGVAVGLGLAYWATHRK